MQKFPWNVITNTMDYSINLKGCSIIGENIPLADNLTKNVINVSPFYGIGMLKQ